MDQSSDLANRMLTAIDQVGGSYERLVLVVAPAGAGKTRAMRQVSDQTGFPYFNVNLALSSLLLEVPPTQRPLAAPRLLDEIIGDLEGDTILLDNLELMFDVALRLQPLNWLRRIARGRSVIAAWSGSLDQGHAVYAVQGHPEYRKERVGDVLVVTPGQPA